MCKTLSHENFGFEDISKQSIEGEVWFLLNAYHKIQKERNDLNVELLSKKEQNFKKIPSLSILEEIRKLVWKRA